MIPGLKPEKLAFFQKPYDVASIIFTYDKERVFTSIFTEKSKITNLKRCDIMITNVYTRLFD